MRRIATIFAIIVLPFVGFAQGISLVEFAHAPADQTANEHGTEVFDINGERCALIRISTTQKGFTFEGGSVGITKVDDNRPAEIWVYVPAGLRRITIHHSQLGNLYDYEFPIALQRGHTYRVRLVAGTVNTVVEEDVGGQFLVMRVSPANATVYVDNRLQTVKPDGTLSLMLTYGRHSYRVEAASYISEAGVVEMGQSKQSLSVTLKSAKATLDVTCSMADALIYINEELKGTGSCRVTLDAGLYVVETRKQGHRSRRQNLTLAEQEVKKLSMPAPEPMYGTLSVDSDPLDAEVWLDGRKTGSTPDIFRNILAGNHELELRKQGYKSAKRTVTISEGKVESVTLTMEKGFSGEGELITVGSVSFVMKPVAGGTFSMGCTSEQGGDCYGAEKPAHSVTLSDYYIGETEVTQALWRAVMGSNPSYNKGDNLPVENVSWDDCQTFISKLNQLTGRNFRLPTEAEWEYAARGGSKSRGYKYAGSNNISDVAWYDGNSGSKTHPVKGKRPNELGLYDMSGNVWEWCSDWYGDYSGYSQTNPQGPSTGSHRLLRGGSWYYGARFCRVANRNYYAPDYRYFNIGFRLVFR